MAGQQFEYAHDDIGNRTQTKTGGDQNGATLRSATYGANSLNQYTNRIVPGAVDVMGLSFATNTVTVNGQTAYRKGEYFRKELAVSNANSPLWTNITVAANGQASVAGNQFVPKTPEQFYYDADGNLTNDGRWKYTWDAENRLASLVSRTNVGPQQLIRFEYDSKGRRIHKQIWSNTTGTGNPTNDVKFVYDGWNLLAELNATNNAVIRSYLWGTDLSGTMQGAGGVGGLLKISCTGTPTTNCFVAFDGNGNVAALADAASTNILAQYEYGPFGEVLRATGPMARANPFRFSTKYQDDETDFLYYGYRYLNTPTGRWLSRDPVGENGGEDLYIFCGNDSLNNWDLLGEIWKVDRNGGAKAAAVPERGDTVADLASMIGLNASEYQRWLTADSGTAMPSSASQAMGGCEHFEIPNTVVAYWAGNLGGVGRWWVRWNSSVKHLGSLGFKVDNHQHQKGDTWGLTKMFIPRSMTKELHGVYFWGHGGRFGPPGSPPYPAEDLFSDSNDPVLAFSSPGLYYHMGLGLVFACDSNSGQSALMSGNGIWKGFTGTLVPWPFRAYHAKHYIHHGNQATH